MPRLNYIGNNGDAATNQSINVKNLINQFQNMNNNHSNSNNYNNSINDNSNNNNSNNETQRFKLNSQTTNFISIDPANAYNQKFIGKAENMWTNSVLSEQNQKDAGKKINEIISNTKKDFAEKIKNSEKGDINEYDKNLITTEVKSNSLSINPRERECESNLKKIKSNYKNNDISNKTVKKEEDTNYNNKKLSSINYALKSTDLKTTDVATSNNSTDDVQNSSIGEKFTTILLNDDEHKSTGLDSCDVNELISSNLGTIRTEFIAENVIDYNNKSKSDTNNMIKNIVNCEAEHKVSTLASSIIDEDLNNSHENICKLVLKKIFCWKSRN